MAIAVVYALAVALPSMPTISSMDPGESWNKLFARKQSETESHQVTQFSQHSLQSYAQQSLGLQANNTVVTKAAASKVVPRAAVSLAAAKLVPGTTPISRCDLISRCDVWWLTPPLLTLLVVLVLAPVAVVALTTHGCVRRRNAVLHPPDRKDPFRLLGHPALLQRQLRRGRSSPVGSTVLG